MPATKYLTLDEVRRLSACVQPKKDKLLIQMGFAMGCRVSEIVHLPLENIKPDRIVLWDKKKKRTREAVIDSDTRALLGDYLNTEWKPKRGYRHELFYFSARTANRILKRWCKVAGIPDDKAHWHVLRHTYVIQSLDAEVPINHVCEQTGDSPVTIVRVYGRPSIDKRREMLEDRGCYWRAG